MKPRANKNPRVQKTNNAHGEGSNWALIAGGALLSTLSIRLGYKLKQALDTKRQDSAGSTLKGNGKFTDRRRSGACTLHSNVYSFTQDEDGCYHCLSGISDGIMESKHHPLNGPMLKENESELPLVAVSAPPGSNRENGVMWASSPDRLELPRKPFHHSNSSDSPCVSESGSDIFSKREVIQKLRQQLKRRDDMIVEMQDQIMELQSSLNSQVTHSNVLQSQLEAANQDLFDSEREIQRLRKAIADHCVGEVGPTCPSEKLSTTRKWVGNGHSNGFLHNGQSALEEERIDMLRREVGELKEVIEGKEYLLQTYKEQKLEMCSKITELQQRLASHVPSIL
ncbi:hypothetical protein GIB67_011700 [Kingdonia uniflora]|uniref:Uncharacterized protein n=1 Tax=Kingdonia uniflora TaxID=39325 RepID=A0A7J7LUK2_9MAGN|nr:hypothetical protein GIB67_011700 [Kingdonia uniflora]